MNPVRLTTGVLFLLAVVLLILVQFLPWGSNSQSGGGGSFETTAYTWETRGTADAGIFGSFSEDRGWYDSSWNDVPEEDKHGLTEVRIAIPLLLTGLVLAAIAGLLAFTVRGAPSAILGLVATFVLGAAIWLFAGGVNDLFKSDISWGVSFYLAIAGGALLLVGGVLGLMSGNRASTAI